LALKADAFPRGGFAIKQVAALPYRTEEDGSTSVLLITSRETRRWVLPKGNPIKGLDAHLAAAHEAFEEAGVSGIPCATPLGTYRYVKKRKNGTYRKADVQVFPLAYVDQAEDWPEQDERETSWFTLNQAAQAVDESDLKALISNFQIPPPLPDIGTRMQTAAQRTISEKIPMLKWFHALMPKQGRFFEQFEAHAALLVAGADALALLLQGGDNMDIHVREIVAREQDADDITRDVLQDVRRTFVTPFDRSAITSLIGVMDDAIDQMNGTEKAIELFEVTEFEPQMRDMAGLIVEAARVTVEAIPLLRSIADNATRINGLTERLVRIEGHADEIHDIGLKNLFKTKAAANPMAFIVGQEIYSHLEKILDRFEDVANEIQGLVIDHA
jgi:uncharacterized protein Yka (UPF0111/DUF47 family)/8-oxo-dGTP pyrophosphatase MutT (NUDIX family)